MRRGEVWWAELGGSAGRRPVLLLHRDAAYRQLHEVIVAEVTTTIRTGPSFVLLTRADGLFARCVVNRDNVYKVEKEKLTECITALRAEKMVRVHQALDFVLGRSV